MNLKDAAKILNVSGNLTKESTKITYIKLSKKYHPDINPAGLELMKLINGAYDVLKDYEGNISLESDINYGEALNVALGKIIELKGLDIEICGAWVWVTGNTKEHSAALKAAGFKWANKKLAWFFRPDDHKSFSRGNYNLDTIRTIYGTSKPHLQQNKLAAA